MPPRQKNQFQQQPRHELKHANPTHLAAWIRTTSAKCSNSIRNTAVGHYLGHALRLLRREHAARMKAEARVAELENLLRLTQGR